jgi:hypothetical protein
MAGRAQWQQTYVTDDTLFCVYIADDAETVAEHAKAGGFPLRRRASDPHDHRPNDSRGPV